MCLCACSACTPPLLTGVFGVGVHAWARVLAAPRHSYLGCWGVCVFVCALRLYPATPCWSMQSGCVCCGSGFGCAPPLVAGVLGCLCVCLRAPLVPRQSCLGCAVWVCVLGLGFWLRPGTPGWGVGVCVCLYARSPFTPPLLARVCGVGVCASAQVLAAPHHSWPGCWGVCVCLCACSACTPPLLAGVCGLGVCGCARVSAAPRHSWLGYWAVCVFVCLLRLYPATPGWGVWCRRACLGSGFGCAPQLLAGVLGCVCVCVRAPLVPHHSPLGYAVGVCVLRLGLRLRPAPCGWGVGLCVCLCACSACTAPLLARVCCAGVCASARVSAAPRHSWQGCWVVCVFDARSACTPPLLAGVCVVGVCVCGLRFRLRPACPGWNVGVCVYLCACSACTPRLLAGGCCSGVCGWAQVSDVPRHSWLGCWGVCVFVCVLRLYPSTPGWGVRCWCGCLGSGFSCPPQLLPGVLGCGCVHVRVPLVPRHSWLGFAVWHSAFWLRFRLPPARPGLGVWTCVCFCARVTPGPQPWPIPAWAKFPNGAFRP